MKNRGTHSSLLALAGAYLLYLAYEMFTAMRDGSTSMAPGLSILFIALFALAGLGILVYAALEWKRRDQEEEKPPRNENDNSLK